MTAVHALILGLVEGITEFLPISSTGHLILLSGLLHLPETDFLKSFEIAIQLGAILAAVVFYWKPLLTKADLLIKVIVAFMPTAVIGLVLHDFVKRFLLGDAAVVLWSLFVGGIVLIVFERWHGDRGSIEDLRNVTLKQSLLIGLFQSIAIIPGISRSAATIIGGQLLGLKRRTIVDFSFMLAIPTMAAATGLDLLKSGSAFTPNEFVLLTIGFAASFITALAAIKWLLGFVRDHSLQGFGVYRIIVAIGFAAILWRS